MLITRCPVTLAEHYVCSILQFFAIQKLMVGKVRVLLAKVALIFFVFISRAANVAKKKGIPMDIAYQICVF